MQINPLFQVDFYKTSHHAMYPKGTTKIYSNLTPRKSRLPDVNKIVVFGIQYFILEYLIKQWNEQFFNAFEIIEEEVPYDRDIALYPGETYTVYRKVKSSKDQIIPKYSRMMDATLGKGAITTKHLEDLWDLGYLPLQIKSLPEGSLCPIGVPCLTITNTVDHAFWLVNYLETILSCTVWQPITSATIAHEYKKLLSKYAIETTGTSEFVQWQGHDFSMRGMSSLESACTSGAGHLLSFTGTDTIPAISFLEQYYGADVEKELVGASVPATEHSVMCMGTQGDEIGTFKRLLDQFPSGILSVVSDTWDLWKVCTDYIVQLKEQILARDGKLVIRPDSGDPVDIICGKQIWQFNDLSEAKEVFEYKIAFELPIFKLDNKYFKVRSHKGNEFIADDYISTPADKGVIQLLWDVFGGIINDRGYKVLDPHIGAIYGDSITLERAEQICERLKAKGFASTNIVLGVGSYTYQYNTRDTFGFAVKATYGEIKTELIPSHPPYNKHVLAEAREIFKDPITDDGTKKSAKGLLRVEETKTIVLDSLGSGIFHESYVLKDRQYKWQEVGGALETVFLDGTLVKTQTLSEIRARLASQI